MAYALDLRLKALQAYENGKGSQIKIANLFQIGISTFKRWVKKYKAGESLEPPHTRSGRPPKIDEVGKETIRQLVEKNPSITLRELSEIYYKRHKVLVGSSILSRLLQKLNLRYKKLSISAAEKETDEVKKKKTLPASNKRSCGK